MRIRSVQPEVLETLAYNDPAALRSRQDLLLVNGIMGNHRWISRMVRQHCQPDWQITELGAGDGALSHKLAEQKLCQTRDLHAFDLAPRPASWPADAAWTQGDLFAQNLPPSQVLIANLFLHHFQAEQLHLLGSRIAPETQFILAAEPARYRIHTFMGSLFCSLTQLNWVTRYDMQVSIRAGFRGQELPHFLGLDSSWEISVWETVFGGYRMMARRK